MASIEITGLDEILVRRGYKSILDMHIPMTKALTLVHNEIATYPPQRPSNYRRTGTLGRSWTTKLERMSTKLLSGKVGTNIKYAPYVQSEELQARQHRGHWQTDEQVLDENEDRINSIFFEYLLGSLT